MSSTVFHKIKQNYNINVDFAQRRWKSTRDDVISNFDLRSYSAEGSTKPRFFSSQFTSDISLDKNRILNVAKYLEIYRYIKIYKLGE